MQAADVVPLLLGLFAILGVGHVLRRTGRLTVAGIDVVQGLIIDVTMPALIVSILAQSPIDLGVGRALVATTTALVVCIAVGVAIARAFRLPRPTQGAAGMTAGFCNTGFLGVPVVVALFGKGGSPASTAIVIDAVNTTLMMWTFGVAFAQRFGGDAGPLDGAALRRLATRPMTLALAFGLGLQALDLGWPAPVLAVFDTVGRATTPLVFLSLGASLDLHAVRGNVAPMLAVVATKVLVAPAVALGVIALLGEHGPAGQVAVVQSAMPTALASVIVCQRNGCDGAFAAGVAVLATLATVATLPLALAMLHRWS